MYSRVHAIGDSHVLHMGGQFHVHHICDDKGQGATAHNLLAESSSTNSKQKIDSLLKSIDSQSDILLLSFGEVDCRLHLNSTVGVANTVARYTAAIEGMVARGFRVIVHAVIGAVPQDAPDRLPVADRGWIVNEFNGQLSNWCKLRGVEMLWPKTADALGVLHADCTDDGVHLNDKAAALYAEWAKGADVGESMDRIVWCIPAMQHFGKIAARALGWPLVIDGPVGDCDVVFVVGMYDAPHYQHTLAMTSRAKKRIIQWCGADARVLQRPELLPEAVHTASFDIYRDRVRAKGVTCETLYLPTYFHPEPMPLPDKPVITAYLGSNPPAYGAGIVAALAECLPDVQFKVVPFGTYGEDGMQRLISESSISIQAGNLNGGSTTREMMAAGRIALSTIPMPHARLISEDDFTGILAAVQKALTEKATGEQVGFWRSENSDELFASRVEALCSA